MCRPQSHSSNTTGAVGFRFGQLPPALWAEVVHGNFCFLTLPPTLFSAPPNLPQRASSEHLICAFLLSANAPCLSLIQKRCVSIFTSFWVPLASILVCFSFVFLFSIDVQTVLVRFGMVLGSLPISKVSVSLRAPYEYK